MKRRIFSISWILFLSATMMANADLGLLVHRIDYIQSDYSGCVSNSKITDDSEYKELQGFINQIEYEVNSDSKLSTKKDLLEKVSNLSAAINSRKDVSTVKILSKEIKQILLSGEDFVSGPTTFPNIANAIKTYSAQCASCHGYSGNGNGELAASLTPKPRNFLETKRMYEYTPLQAYNTILHGVEGTSMKAFTSLTEQERWELAFYVVSFRYSEVDSEQIQKSLQKQTFSMGAAELAIKSDQDLVTDYNIQPENREYFLASVRKGISLTTSSSFINTALAKVDVSILAFKAKKTEEAKKAILESYLNGFEPVELQVKSSNPALAGNIEKTVQELSSPQAGYLSVAAFESKANQLKGFYLESTEILSAKEYNFLWSFLLTLSILLRESMEVILVLAIIVQLLIKTGKQEHLKSVGLGIGAALFSGIILWFLADQLMNWGMSSIEFYEGIFSLVAVAVILYMGFWMHQHSEISKWKAFIKEKLDKLINNKSSLGLIAFVFFIAGREVLESVMFLSALNIENDGKAGVAIGFGTLVSLIVSVFAGVIIIRFTQKLPIPTMLRISSVVLAILSVVLLGKSVHSFQETGLIPISATPWDFRFDVLGFYPTWQSFSIQVIGLLTLIILSVIPNFQKHSPPRTKLLATDNSSFVKRS